MYFKAARVFLHLPQVSHDSFHLFSFSYFCSLSVFPFVQRISVRILFLSTLLVQQDFPFSCFEEEGEYRARSR